MVIQNSCEVNREHACICSGVLWTWLNQTEWSHNTMVPNIQKLVIFIWIMNDFGQNGKHLSKLQMVGPPGFRSHLKSGPFAKQPILDHLKSRLAHISDVLTIYLKFFFCLDVLWREEPVWCWPKRFWDKLASLHQWPWPRARQPGMHCTCDPCPKKNCLR